MIKISDEIKRICPEMAIGVVCAEVKAEENNEDLWNEIEALCVGIKNGIRIQDISDLANNKESRQTYRKLGKDPTRYRISSEALLRRIVKGKGLYKVNNIVDINNLLSITSHYSIGTFNMHKIKGNITMRIGKKDEPYVGIGRGEINIEKLPVLSDELGPFGSPTSDTERTMIKLDTTKILMTILGFSGSSGLDGCLNKAKELLEKYAHGKEIVTYIVE